MLEAEERHQYVERQSGYVRDEQLFWDGAIRFLYSSVREQAPSLFTALTSRRMSSLLGFLNYDSFVTRRLVGGRRFVTSCGIEMGECVDGGAGLDTLAKIFERQIRYWECRPMPDDSSIVVSPADARVVCGSLSRASLLRIKGKFFDLDELLGKGRNHRQRFAEGDWAVFRLTPEKYHYNHAPVAGVVADFYELSGANHSCNPSAMVEVVTPLSKNQRCVTVIDTDVPHGSRVGLVAMIEVGALMIGGIVQCYSDERYERPRPVEPGLFLRRGAPKSRYRPGGSTDVLLFEKGRIRFREDLVRNQQRTDVASRFSTGFGYPLAETDVCVRSAVAERMR
jgi:phosphatidylserine decarboxylase